MADESQTLFTTLAASVARKLLLGAGASLATHGVIASNQTETFVSAGLFLLGVAWSFWNDYGRAITLSKLAVWKAAAEAQAAKLQQANIPGPTAHDIANRVPSPAVTGEVVTKVMTAGCIALLAMVLLTQAASAQGTLAPQKHDLKTRNAAMAKPRTDSTDLVVPGAAAGSAQGIQSLSNVLSGVKQFTVDDLTAAAEDADSQVCPNDPTQKCPDPAGDCWRVLIPLVQAQQSPLPKGLGLAQAIQKARDIQRQVRGGVPDQVKTKCAIVLWDAEAALLRFGIQIAPIPKLPIPGL